MDKHLCNYIWNLVLAMKKVGIDSLAYYVPSLYLDIEELAEKRNIPAEKLVHGLGLKTVSYTHLTLPTT